MTGTQDPPSVLRLSNPLCAVVWLTLFTPGRLFPGFELLWAVAVCLLGCAILLGKPSPWPARRPSRQAAIVFLLLQLLYVLSWIYSAAFKGMQAGPGGFFEPARYLLFGAFAVYLIRHHDASVRGSMGSALTAFIYFSLLMLLWGDSRFSPFEPWNPAAGYLSILALCHMLFLSRSRMRMLHAVAALSVVFLAGFRAAETAALLVLAAAFAVKLRERLERVPVKYSFRWSTACFALLTACVIRFHLAAGGGFQDAQTFRWIRSSLMLGWGPVSYASLPQPHNQYVAWMLRNGLLGMGLILTGLGIVTYKLLRGVGADRRPGAAAFLAAAAIMLTGGRFLDSFRLYCLTGFFVAGLFEEQI